MKKTITLIITLFMLASVTTTAFAAELSETSNPKTKVADITLNIAPAYVVTIPDNANIDFNATSTTLGTVKATHMQIEPNKMVVVSAAAGELKNQIDEAKTIPYKLMNSDAEFSSINLTNTEQSADLTVAITEDDWNKAYAGDYNGKITFTISYEDKAE